MILLLYSFFLRHEVVNSNASRGHLVGRSFPLDFKVFFPVFLSFSPTFLLKFWLSSLSWGKSKIILPIPYRGEGGGLFSKNNFAWIKFSLLFISDFHEMSLKRHIKDVHFRSENTCVICPQCCKQYASQNSLYSHLNRVKANDQNNYCFGLKISV